jgi:hypothetical protein
MGCDTIFSFIAVIIAFSAVVFSVAGFQVQIILSQLAYKAEECNKYILSETQQIQVEDIPKLSAIVSTIITANQILNINYKIICIIFKSKQSCIDQFYLQLHTSIRELVNSNKDLFQKYQNEKTLNKIIKQQLIDSNKFLLKSIKKWQ